MLQNIRNNIQGAFAKGLIILITVPFILTGAETLLSSSGAKKVAKVNGEEITQQQLEEEVFLLKRRLMAQMGDSLDPAQLEDRRLREPALETIINQTILQQAASNAGMTVSDAELNRMITQTEEFQENGRFSPQLYTAVLGAAGLTPVLYKRLYQDDILRSQFINGLVATDFATAKEIELNAQLIYQTRDVRFLTLDIVKQIAKTQVSQEAAQEFYANNQMLFQSPEQLSVEYIELTQAQYTPEISEEELQQAYNDEIQHFAGNEQRQVSHILLLNDDEKTRATLAQVQQKLAEGASFATLAQQYSEDSFSKTQGGLLGELNEAAFPAAFVSAAKQLKEGEVSAVVKTEAGLHLIRVNQVYGSEPRSFAERSDALRKELQEAKANPLFIANVEKLKDFAFNAPDLQLPAKETQAKVQDSGLFTRQGGQGIFANPKVIQAAFSDNVVENGYNSEVIELSAEHVVVLRKKAHYPEKTLAFEEVQARVDALLKRDIANKTLSEKANALAQQLAQGADIEQLAKENQIQWQVLLQTGRNVIGADAPVVAKAFTLAADQSDAVVTDTLTLNDGSVVVLAVNHVKAGQVDTLTVQERDSLMQFIAQTKGTQSYQLLQNQLETSAKIKRY